MQFLARLDADDIAERWLVQAPGASTPHVLWVIDEHHHDQRDEVERATRPWIGPIHPRVAAIFGTRWHGTRLVIETDDDRGPTLATAAAQLTDPVERERWVIAQIIGIADGLATMRQRDRTFVHRRLEPSRLIVDVAGHARLRPPIPYVEQGPRPGRVGMGVVRGVPEFMAPEQARGMPTAPATDVFSLAATLYHALAGARPFPGDSPMEVFTAMLMQPPTPITTHAPGLQRVLDRAFAKDVEARIPDVGAFAGELWQCVPDAMEYDAVISDRIVAWRATAESAERPVVFGGGKCRMKWEQLVPSANGEVRHCNSCREDVVRVSSLAAIVPLAGRCVAYTGGD